MIFISLGSRDYQFDRLLKKMDELIINQVVEEDVFAQIGQSNYIPKNYKYERFLSSEEFNACQSNASLVISHGGTGALVGALKKQKQVIAVPRLAKYGEHLDDHQLQVSEALSNKGFLITVVDMEMLGEEINNLKKNPILKKYDIPSNAITIIKEFLEN